MDPLENMKDYISQKHERPLGLFKSKFKSNTFEFPNIRKKYNNITALSIETGTAFKTMFDFLLLPEVGMSVITQNTLSIV